MKKPLQLSKAKSLKAIISACIMVSAAGTANAQNYFELTFGNPGTQYERFNSGTYFGGDLVGAGYATSPSGAYIVRVDAATGQYLWQTRLGDATEVNSIQNTADGNMILGGTKLNGSNSNKMALTKINGNGGWLWTKTFSSAFQCQAEKAIQTSDGGYAIFGIRDWDLMNQFASGKLYMVKTNSSGDSLWAKNYGVPAGWQRGHDMIELSGGGYMLCGESYNSVSTIGGSIIIRTNSVGDTLWTRTVGTGYDGAKKLIQSGSYIYVLNQLSMNSQGQILRFDLNGNHIVLSNLPNNVGVGGFVKNQGGSFSVALSDYNSDNVKIYNVNTSGVAQLIHTFSGDYQLDANQLIPTWTSQLAVFGRDYDYQVGAEDAWVASFDTLGNVQQITNCSVEIGVSDTTVCQGAYIPNPQPTGQAPFTYYWTPPVGMSNPNIANPVIEDVFNQQYTLVVTDANGCTAVDNVIVTSYTASSDSVYMCTNNSATLNLGPGSSYQWLNFLDTLGNYTQLNQTTQSITVTQPGTYTALEYTQGCGVLTSQFFVGLCEDACSNAWNLFTYQHNPYCGGDSIFFAGTGSGQIVSWQWYASPNFFSTSSTGWLVLTQNTPQLVELITIDANNCTAYSSMTITPLNNNLSVDLGQDTVICNGNYTINPIITGGTGPYTYQWQPANEIANPNQANQTFSNVYNETFWLWVTDAQGCETLDTINITAVNTLDHFDTVYACNNQTYLELAPGAFSYHWINGATTQGIVYTGTGQISGYGVYPNCSLYDFFTVLPCNNNCANQITFQHNPYCSGDSILLYGTGNSQITSWQWYVSGYGFLPNQPNVWLNYSGGNQPLYVVLTTVDNNNCTANSNIQITPITQNIAVYAGEDTVICNGSYTATAQATGGSGNYTYLWEPQSYFSDPTLQSQTFSNVYNGTFWVWATDVNGCTSLDTIVVTALSGPSSNDTVYLCNSQAYLLLPTGAQYYNWSNGSTTAGIVTSTSGTYTGYGYYQGCGTVLKTFHVLPCNTNCFNVFTYQHNPWACGDSVLFVGTSGSQIANWTWDFGDGQIETNSFPSVYHLYPPEMGVSRTVTLTTTDVNGCTATSSNTILIQGGTPVTVNAGNDFNLCQPGTYQMNATANGGTGTYTYQWTPSTGLSNTNIPNPGVIVQGPICYIVTATDANGCSDMDTICLDYIHPVNDTVYLCNSTVELCMQEGAFNYIWTTTGEQTNCITVSDTGSYFAYAWFGGCPTTSNYYTVLPCEQTCYNDFNYQSNPWACGDSVLFNANASAQCFVYMWDFGDGSTFNSNLPSLYHYYSAGTYTVTLTTIDVNGCTSVMTQTITINDGFDVNITAYYSNVEEWNINNGSNITSCGGTLYDSGGPNGNYQNNENLAFSVYPATQGNVTSLNFSYFNSETNYDFITIYNNNSASGTILYGPASGSLNIGTITANLTNNPTGALTIKFTSDYSIVLGGFEAAVSCQSPNGQPQYPDSIFACQGVAHLNATPTVPGNYFYQWSPSTGLDNPYIANPVASMVNNVQYTVTVTDVNTGCSSSDDIVVTSYTFIVDTFEVCGDSITLDFGPGATQYYWQYYTDPQGNGSGLNLYTQTINVINPGTYFGYAYFPGCGALTSLFNVVACETDSVWPGDANADGLAHNMDLLTIGIGYGTNGLLRPNATINWQPEASPAWGQQLVSGVDYKHIDCNGDAVIDVNDTLAVIQNYGSIHSFNGIETRSDNDPMLYLTAPVDTVLTGTSVVVPVNLGTDTVPANDVYGIGFTVHYNPDLLQTNSMGINFNNSWFGVHGLNAISIRKNFHAQGMMDVALTRIDHQNISGHGTIGELNFITIDNLSGKETLYQTLDLYITDVKLIRNNEDEVQLGIQNDSIVVTNLGISVHELNSLEAGISVYPNPTKDVLNVVIESTAFGQQTTAEILNATGQVISISNLTSNISSLNVSDLAAGIYFVRISTEQGMVSKRFTVIK